MSVAYYNEHDPKAAAWLRELIKAGLIAPGVVDERSIVDVNPYELTQYTQHHFFAGIGGWSYALRLAGWPDHRRIVTGSCPCQPFSAAGLGLGTKDERHLWPSFYNIITFLEAPIALGEQVASAAGRHWLAGVRADLEALGYAVGAADLCAAGVGAPHIRQRIYWMAHREGAQQRRPAKHRINLREVRQAGPDGSASTRRSGCACRMGNANHTRLQERPESEGRGAMGHEGAPSGEASALDRSGRWNNYILVHCADGKARRIESGLSALAHGVPNRVGLLRGYGNAIVPQVAAEFIKAAVETIN